MVCVCLRSGYGRCLSAHPQRQGELLARQSSALTSSFSSALWTPVDFAAKAAWSVVSSIGGRTEPADLIPFFKLPQDVRRCCDVVLCVLCVCVWQHVCNGCAVLCEFVV